MRIGGAHHRVEGGRAGSSRAPRKALTAVHVAWLIGLITLAGSGDRGDSCAGLALGCAGSGDRAGSSRGAWTDSPLGRGRIGPRGRAGCSSVQPFAGARKATDASSRHSSGSERSSKQGVGGSIPPRGATIPLLRSLGYERDGSNPHPLLPAWYSQTTATAAEIGPCVWFGPRRRVGECCGRRAAV